MMRAHLLASLAGAVVLSAAPVTATSIDGALPAEKSAVMVAEPIWLRLSCSNAGGEPVDLDFATANGLAWRISPRGGPTPCHADTRVEDSRVQVPPWRITVRPGGAINVRLLLNRWVRLDHTGTFRVTLESCADASTPLVHSANLTIWKAPAPHEVALTNEVTLEVVPADEHRLRAICEDLTSEAPRAEDTDEGLQAAEALSWVDLPLGEPYLERLLPINSFGSVLAVKGLARIGSPAAVKALIMAFDHTNPWTRLAIKDRLLELNPQLDDPGLRNRLDFILTHEASKLVEPH